MRAPKSVLFLALFVSAVLSAKSSAVMPSWSYDPGPNPEDPMGRELIDITAKIPNMPAISKKIIGRYQKFRPAFGPIPWRMLMGENKVKMLFIGQDGTHIAEAAGRPATAGFGGRAQDLANYFGVNEGAAFINAYSFTIKGQYGIYNTPYVYNKNGENYVGWSNFIDNKLWAMSMGLESPITKWRNSLIDWVIRNNKESMKLIVLFGGAARDAVATYAKSKGADVKAYREDDMPYIQVPETKSEYAGGNNTFPSLLSKDGKDLYEKMLGERVSYRDRKDQIKVMDHLEENINDYLNEMVFTKAGQYKNGMLEPAQLGGYDLSRMSVNGIKTRSLKGLVLDDGTVIQNDIIVISLPHPSSLSRTVMEAETYSHGKQLASQKVMRKVKLLNKYAARGWNIEADPGKTNYYAQGKDYEYGRSDIGPEFYDFGTPENRMVSRSSARRMSGNPNVVIIGTRDRGYFPDKKIDKMTEAKPAFGVNPEDLYIARPRSVEGRYVFDPGPGEKYAKLMVNNLELKKILEPKEGMSWKEDGIDAYNVKTHPDVSDFGHYRGTFDNPEVIVLADPIGYDDLVTARALTGERGQYIHGLMQDIGVEDNYLVLKTVPFGMDGATDSEWQTVLEQTKRYREAVLKELLKDGKPKLILTDGKWAASESARILKNSNLPVVNMPRYENSANGGIKYAGAKISKLGVFGDMQASGSIANIPRSHLSFYARVWEGTSGDRVITSKGKEYQGLAFAEVVPEWAYEQKAGLSQENEEAVEKMIRSLEEQNAVLPYERIPEYLERTNCAEEEKEEDRCAA